MPGVHALLGASSAKRWMSCPPSARLEERLKEILGESSSPFAEEGTKAHALAELKLLLAKHQLGDEDGIDSFVAETRRKELGVIPAEMEHATDYYADLIIEKLMTARKVCPDAKLLTEQRLDFSDWVPEGFGTGDAVIVSDQLLEVLDLKYGKGVPVSAIHNPQARLYGLGAYAKFGSLYDFTEVRNTIIQPRLDSVTEEALSIEELLAWAKTELVPAAELAWEGKGEFKPGDHCRFCLAKAVCRARAMEAMTIFEHQGLAAPATISDTEIPEILRVADTAANWLSDLKAYAFDRALKGGIWPGYKLVHGRKPPRKWTDEASAREILTANGYDRKDWEKTELRTVAQIEKLVGKEVFANTLDGLSTQAEEALTLVPESDAREEYSSANADFSDLL